MPKKNAIAGLTFTEACEYLALSPDELAALREAGMIACLREHGKQLYPKEALDVTLRLLRLADNQQWSRETLAWYADLCFATAIGRALLLPIDTPQNVKSRLSASWLETPNIVKILGDFESGLDGSDETLINLLRSIVAGATGDGQLWLDDESLQRSALYPIITHFEALGHQILEQGQAIARDAGPILGGKKGRRARQQAKRSNETILSNQQHAHQREQPVADQLFQPGIYILHGTNIVNDLHITRVETCLKIWWKGYPNFWTECCVAVKVKLEHQRFISRLINDCESGALAGDNLTDMFERRFNERQD